MGDTHPVAPGPLRHVSLALDDGGQALRRAAQGMRGRGPAPLDGEGTQVPEGCQQRSLAIRL